MGRVLVQQLVSADGFAAGPSGELDFFDAAGDLADLDRDMLPELDRTRHIVLGRVTYELFAGFWPTADEHAELVTRHLNTIPKTVLSATLTAAPWGSHAPATVESGDPAAAVRRLAGDGDVIVWGSLSVCAALLDAGAVDEVELRILPVWLGEGRRFLPGDGTPRPLRLRSSKAYPNGVVVVRYSLRERTG
jgi:dihydrofolate reductase